MSATNYARKGGYKREPFEVRFFGPNDEIPRECIAPEWVWWRVPRDYHEVRLVAETRDEWMRRLNLRSSNGSNGNGNGSNGNGNGSKGKA